ncbi:MAG: hypothetical protein V4621_05620 [Pseudomonadota bacterium]
MAKPTRHDPSDHENENWKRAKRISISIHLGVIILIIFGLPFLPDREYDTPIPVGIEVMDVSEIAQTNVPEASSRKAEKPEKEKPPEPVKPQVTEPPKPKVEDKPKPAPEKPKEETPTPPPVDDLADVKEEKPKEKPKDKPKPAPEKPKEEKPKDEPDETQETDFESVLKNLTPETPTTDAPAEKDVETDAPPAEEAAAGALSDRLTMSEMDALRQQLSRCWSITAGAENAEDLVIEIRMQVSAERIVQSAEVVDLGRYAADTYFRAAADSALRAVRNPLCSPLELPEGKHDQWKSLKVRFDPREML